MKDDDRAMKRGKPSKRAPNPTSRENRDEARSKKEESKKETSNHCLQYPPSKATSRQVEGHPQQSPAKHISPTQTPRQVPRDNNDVIKMGRTMRRIGHERRQSPQLQQQQPSLLASVRRVLFTKSCAPRPIDLPADPSAATRRVRSGMCFGVLR